MAEVVIKNKLVIKDLGDPKGVHKKDGDNAQIVLGTLFGICTGVGSKTDQRDPTKVFHFLKGDFEGVPSEKDADRTRSGVLYLPDGMHNLIASQFAGDNAPDKLQFALEVIVKKAKNPAGYEFGFNPKIKASEADPLEALRDQLKIPALEDKSTQKGKSK